MIENTNTKQFYPGPILNNTLEITDFLFNDAEQIKIKHSKLDEEGVLRDVDLNYPTDYEVTKVLPSDINAAEAALTASTGQITLKNINVLAGEKLTVYRVSLIIQDKDYPRTGAFPAATHEGALDYLTMQNQEQKDEIDRALKVPISTQNFEGSLPLPIPSRALKINNDGTGFEMSEFDPDLALVTTEEFKNQSQQAAAEALAAQNAATEQATIATQQASIATEKTTEVVESGITAVQNIDTAFNAASEWFAKLNALQYIPVGTILPNTGAIDESLGYQRYANGQLIANVSSQAPDLVKFLEFQEAHAPNLLCSETEWQTALTLSTLGQVGKYVWNKEEDFVRIPRIVNIQGMMDMNTVGNMVEAGLPDHTHTYIDYFASFIQGHGGEYPLVSSDNTFDTKTTQAASLSNPIYGKSNTVQEESILYPYVLQIATGVQYKTPVQNELMSNNPFFFGYYQFFEVAPNNISWLKSAAQWNSAKTHGDYYNWLCEERRNPKDIPVRANVTKVGNIIDEGGVLSGFSTSNYAMLLNNFNPSIYNWSWVIKINFSDVTTLQTFVGGVTAEYAPCKLQIENGKLKLWLSENNSGSFVAGVLSDHTFNVNTDYYIKVEFNGSSYIVSYSTDGITYTDTIIQNINKYIYSAPIGFGLDVYAKNPPFAGSIDLNESYINIDGQRWWSGMKSKVRLHTEDYDDYDWVINQSDQTFRLPLKVLGASGSAVVGNGMTLGLTNGTTQTGLRMLKSSVTGLTPAWNAQGLTLPGTDSSSLEIADYTLFGVTTNPTTSGIETSTQGLSLYFYVGGVAKNEHLVDVGRIEEKVDTLIPDNSSLISRYGMPTNKIINLQVGASDTSYTMPATGWLRMGGDVIGTSGYACIDYNGFAPFSGQSGAKGAYVIVNAPVQKNTTVRVRYGGLSNQALHFIYAEGEV